MSVDVPSPVNYDELLRQAQRDVRPEEVPAQVDATTAFGSRDQRPEEVVLPAPTSAAEVTPAIEEEHFELPLSEEDAWAMWQTLKQAQAIDTTQTQHLKVLSKPALAAPADVLAAHTWLVGQYQAHKAGLPIPRAEVVMPPVIESSPAVSEPPATPEPSAEPASPPPVPEVPPAEPVPTTPSVEQPPEPQPVPPPVEPLSEFNPFKPKSRVSPEPPPLTEAPKPPQPPPSPVAERPPTAPAQPLPKRAEWPEKMPTRSPELVESIDRVVRLYDQLNGLELINEEVTKKLDVSMKALRGELSAMQSQAELDTAVRYARRYLDAIYQKEARRIEASNGDYYRVLGVEKDADAKTIQRRYRKLTRLFHPDTATSKVQQPSPEVFKIVAEAYEVLSDEQKRRAYDKFLTTPRAQETMYRPGTGTKDALADFMNVLERMMMGQFDYLNQDSWGIAGTWPNTSWPGGAAAATSPETAPKRDFKPLFEKLTFATTFTELHRLLVQLGDSTYRFKLSEDEILLPGQVLNRIVLLKEAIAKNPDNQARIKAYLKTLKPLGGGLGKAIEQAVTNSLPDWKMLVSGQPAHIQLLRNAAGALMSEWDELGLLDEQGNQIMKFSRLHALLSELATWEQTTDQEAANHVYKLLLQLPSRFDLDLRVIAILKKKTTVNWMIPVDKQARYNAYKPPVSQ